MYVIRISHGDNRIDLEPTAEDSAARLGALRYTRDYPYANGVRDHSSREWEIVRGDPIELLHAMAVQHVLGWEVPDTPGRDARLLAARTTTAEPKWVLVNPTTLPVGGWLPEEPLLPGDSISLGIGANIGTKGAWPMAIEHWYEFGLDPGRLTEDDVSALRFGVWRNLNFRPRAPRFAGLTQYVIVIPAFAPDIVGMPSAGAGGPTLQIFALYRPEE